MKVRRTIDTIEKACIWNDAIESVIVDLRMTGQFAEQIRERLMMKSIYKMRSEIEQNADGEYFWMLNTKTDEKTEPMHNPPPTGEKK